LARSWGMSRSTSVVLPLPDQPANPKARITPIIYAGVPCRSLASSFLALNRYGALLPMTALMNSPLAWVYPAGSLVPDSRIARFFA